MTTSPSDPSAAAPSASDSAIAARVPPNQSLVAPGRWPVVGERVATPPEGPWTVRIHGAVERELSWTVDELRAMPQTRIVYDVHCVTRWTRLDACFSGVPLATLVTAAGPSPDATHVRFVAHTERRHDTSLVLGEAIELGAMVALAADDAPLEPIHGGPVRIVTPGRYFYKSLKWLAEIELLTEDRLGHWEGSCGYHNRGEPWAEQRYMAPDLDRRTVLRVMETRDFSGLDLRSLVAAGLELDGLSAAGAQLRDADFRRARLVGADFTDANLSNAHFERADLRNARFLRADAEGANFSGADLRGADLSGASLFGASFGPEAGPDTTPSTDGVRTDAATRIEPAALDALTPVQRAWVDQAMRRAADAASGDAPES
ncbi:MAG: molybdopterin-dependent oxidoreductase [Phycisphaerales bacterium]